MPLASAARGHLKWRKDAVCNGKNAPCVTAKDAIFNGGNMSFATAPRRQLQHQKGSIFNGRKDAIRNGRKCHFQWQTDATCHGEKAPLSTATRRRLQRQQDAVFNGEKMLFATAHRRWRAGSRRIVNKELIFSAAVEAPASSIEWPSCENKIFGLDPFDMVATVASLGNQRGGKESFFRGQERGTWCHHKCSLQKIQWRQILSQPRMSLDRVKILTK